MWVGVGCQSRSVGLEAGAELVVGSLAGGLVVSRGQFWLVMLSTHALVEEAEAHATLVLGRGRTCWLGPPEQCCCHWKGGFSTEPTFSG